MRDEEEFGRGNGNRERERTKKTYMPLISALGSKTQSGRSLTCRAS